MNPIRIFAGNVFLEAARVLGAVAPPPYTSVQVLPKVFGPSAEIPYGTAYEISPDVYACVRLYAQTIASLPLTITIFDGKKATRIERERGNVLDVWRRANPEQSDFEMVESLVSNLLTFGNLYLLKERFRAAGGDDTTVPMELWPLCSMFMTPVPGQGRTIKEYRYLANGREIIYPARDVAMMRYWSTGDEIVGLSPLAVAAIKVQTGRNADLYMNEFFKAGGGMQGTFSTKIPLNPEQETAFLERLGKRFRNVSKWFLPQFFPSELEWHPTSQTFRDMTIVEVLKMNTTDIAKIYAVPADLIGVDKSGALNTASVEASMLQWVEFGVKPLLRRFERYLDERVLPDFALASSDRVFVECKFDTSDVLAVVKSYLDKAKAITEIVGGPVISKAEGREKLGEEDRGDPKLDVILSIEEEKPVADPNAGEDEDGEQGEPSPPKTSAEPRSRSASRRQPDREAFRDAAELQTERAENRAVHLWNEILRFQEEKVREKIAATRFPAVVRRQEGTGIPEIEEIVQMIADEEIRSDVESFLTRVVRESGKSAIDVVRTYAFIESVAFDDQSLAVRRFLKEFAARAIKAPNDTTRRLLRERIGEAWQAGSSRGEMDLAIAEIFEFRRSNVRTIARTEVLPALNFASLEGYRQSGVVDGVEWITARDEIVRGNEPRDEFLHTAMDGKVADLGEIWRVPRRSGIPEALRYPGDPQGSPANIINCRCRLAPRVAGSRSRGRRGGGAARGEWFANLPRATKVPERNGAGVR